MGGRLRIRFVVFKIFEMGQQRGYRSLETTQALDICPNNVDFGVTYDGSIISAIFLVLLHDDTQGVKAPEESP